MKFKNKKTGDIIDFAPTLLNSALLSAQNRNRFYWTNFKVSQPEDRGILLKDILEEECFDIPSDLSERIKNREVGADQNLTGESQNLVRAIKNGKTPNDKGNTLTACAYKGMGTNGMTNVFTKEGTFYRKLTPLECERLQTLPDQFTLVLDENGKQLVSNTQRYKAIGNGWSVDVIAHILRGAF